MTMCTEKGCGDKPTATGKPTGKPRANDVIATPAPATADIIATTELVEAVVAGTTTLAVRDVTGIRAGDSMTIGSGAGKERATVAAVEVSVKRARREVQAGTVTLTEALQNNHVEGSSMTFERTTSESALAAAAAAEKAAAAAKTQTAIVAVVVVLIVVVIIVGAIVYNRNAQNNQSPIENALAAARTTTNAMQNPQYEATPGANAGDATYDNAETGC